MGRAKAIRFSGTVAALPKAAMLGALGVVYGDIGTSPLYALKEAVRAVSPDGAVSPHAVLGVMSLILPLPVPMVSRCPC